MLVVGLNGLGTFGRNAKLVGVGAGPTPVTLPEPIAKGDLRSVLLDRWHYIIEADGHESLYDVVADPGEALDLAALPEFADRLAAMRAVFAGTWRDAGKRPRLRH